MTVLVTKPAVNIREELADLKDQTTYDTVKSAGALMDVELANEAAVKGIDQALTTTSSVEFTQVTGALVGNASTATALATARDITLSGDVTGSASFNGNANITITATVADDSHNHTISNVDGLQTALDAKQPLDADLTAIAALDSADGNIIVGSASGWVAESGATARASLGLGSIATQAADSVSITGGAISGITDIAVADGGTGASTAADARTNLGLVIGTDVQAYDVDTAKLDVAQSFTAAQRGSTFTTSATGSTTYNFSENQNFVLTLSGNLTLANPTTEAVGQSGFFVFIQPSSGGPYTVSLGTEYYTAGTHGLTLSTAANAVDVVPYIVQASGKILLGTPQLNFVNA